MMRQSKKMPENVKEFIKKSENYKNKENINGNNEKETAEKKTDKTKTNIPNNIEFKYDLEDVVDVLNKLPAKYYDNTNLWKCVTSALKSANLHKEWVAFSKKSSTVCDETSNNNIWMNNTLNIDLTYLNNIAKSEGIKTKLKVHRWCNKLELFTSTPNETRHVEFVELDDFDYDIHPHILIKSATGTGKTQCTSKLIQKIRGEHNYKVLSIVSRISLSEQHKTNFKEIGIVSYQDIKQI